MFDGPSARNCARPPGAPPSTARRRSADSRQTRSAVISAGPFARNVSSAAQATSRRSRRGQTFARTRHTQLRKDERNVGIGPRLPGENSQGLIQGLLDQPRHLGLVRKVETRIQVGLERKFAQQRQAKGIDRADGNVAEPIAQVDPAGTIELRPRRGLTKLAHDALAHFCRGLPREGDCQDVGRIDAALQQIDVARDEHRHLPRSRGGFKDDVVRRIDGKGARVGIGVRRRGRPLAQRHLALVPRAERLARRRARAAMTDRYSSPI